MKDVHFVNYRLLILIVSVVIVVSGSRLLSADTGSCGGSSITLPFTDVSSSNIFFCSIAEAYFDGLTNGTTATTYSPSDPVPREQMAAFITRSQDSALRRVNRRAAMQHWWTPGIAGAMRASNIGALNDPRKIVYDGADLWTANTNAGTVSRVRASDGKVLDKWTGAVGSYGIVAAAGFIFVTGQSGASPGKIYIIDPQLPSGLIDVFENDIGPGTFHITFDGTNLWTANESMLTAGSISRVDVATRLDSTFTADFVSPYDILWDGSNLWVTDNGDNKLKRVNPSSGVVLESINVGTDPRDLIFDGTNIWVTNAGSNSITIVRAVGGLRGTALATLTGNGLNFPIGIAFDGERVLVCNNGSISVSLFNATDFTPLGTVSTGTGVANAPYEACSDGVNFWITEVNSQRVVRF